MLIALRLFLMMVSWVVYWIGLNTYAVIYATAHPITMTVLGIMILVVGCFAIHITPWHRPERAADTDLRKAAERAIPVIEKYINTHPEKAADAAAILRDALNR